MKYLLISALILTACSFDCHVEMNADEFKASAKPKPVEEVAENYLTPEGVIRAHAHGWVIVSVEVREHGNYYHLRRPIIPESAPLKPEKS